MSFTLCSENINQAVNSARRDARVSLHFISTAVKFVTSLNMASVLGVFKQRRRRRRRRRSGPSHATSAASCPLGFGSSRRPRRLDERCQKAFWERSWQAQPLLNSALFIFVFIKFVLK